MNYTNLRTLIDRGRKAGLRTTELYQALSTRQPHPGDGSQQRDGNGYEGHLDSNGRTVYEPKK